MSGLYCRCKYQDKPGKLMTRKEVREGASIVCIYMTSTLLGIIQSVQTQV